MAWTVPVTIDDTTYPLHFDSDDQPAPSDIQWATDQLVKAHSGTPSAFGVAGKDGELIQPESAFQSFVRPIASHIFPSAAGAGGAMAGAAMGSGLDPVLGPFGTIGGGIVGGLAGSFLGQEAQSAALGPEAEQANLAQEQANREANSFTSGMGSMVDPLIAAASGRPTASLQALAKSSPMWERLLSAGAAGARMGASESVQQQIEGMPNAPGLGESMARGALTMGPMGLIPHAKTLLQSLGRAFPDAAIMSVANQLYDYGTTGKPMDMAALRNQFGQDLPGFLIMNGATALFHGPRIANDALLQEGQKQTESLDAAGQFVASDAIQQGTDNYARALAKKQAQIEARPEQQLQENAAAPLEGQPYEEDTSSLPEAPLGALDSYVASKNLGVHGDTLKNTLIQEVQRAISSGDPLITFTAPGESVQSAAATTKPRFDAYREILNASGYDLGEMIHHPSSDTFGYEIVKRPEPRRVAAAAVQDEGGNVIATAPTHEEALEKAGVAPEQIPGPEAREQDPALGFVDQNGQFMPREEAAPVAAEAGQLQEPTVVPEKLHSSDLKPANPSNDDWLKGQPPAVHDAVDERVGEVLLDHPEFNRAAAEGRVADANAQKAQIRDQVISDMRKPGESPEASARDITQGRPPVEPATPQNRRAQDQAALDRLNSETLVPQGLQAATLAETPKGAQPFVDLFEKLFNRRVVFMNHPVNGVVGSDPGTLFIRAKGSVDPISILGHEFTDSLAQEKDPALHRDLMEAMRPLLQNVEGYQERLDKLRARHGLSPADRQLAESEIVADYVGERILHPDFLQRLAQSNPDIFQRVAQSIRDWIQKVKLALGKVGILKGSPFVADLEKADAAVVRMLNAAERRTREGVVHSAAEDPVVQSAAMKPVDPQTPSVRAGNAVIVGKPAQQIETEEASLPRLLSDDALAAELSKVSQETSPFYAKLESLGDSAFTGARYTREAQSIHDKLAPLAERERVLDLEANRRKQEIVNKRSMDARDQRVAEALVKQRRNGWEIVEEGGSYVLRHPETKEEIYRGKLSRVRNVADEGKPEPSTNARDFGGALPTTQEPDTRPVPASLKERKAMLLSDMASAIEKAPSLAEVIPDAKINAWFKGSKKYKGPKSLADVYANQSEYDWDEPYEMGGKSGNTQKLIGIEGAVGKALTDAKVSRVTIKVPGRGEMSIWDTKEALTKIRDKFASKPAAFFSLPEESEGETGGARFSIPAYHGTPHEVDEFTTDKIGTGEGAQAYGWGIYFGERGDTGEEYRNKLAAPGDGNIYTVLLRPDESDFLDWYKPVDEQSEKVKRALAQHPELGMTLEDVSERKERVATLEKDYAQANAKRLKAEEAWKASGGGFSSPEYSAYLGISGPTERLANRLDQAKGWTGQKIYEALTNNGATPEEASKELLRLGIPGIRVQESVRDDAGKNTAHYVVFDNNDIKITHRNGQPVDTARFSLGEHDPDKEDAEHPNLFDPDVADEFANVWPKGKLSKEIASLEKMVKAAADPNFERLFNLRAKNERAYDRYMKEQHGLTRGEADQVWVNTNNGWDKYDPNHQDLAGRLSDARYAMEHRGQILNEPRERFSLPREDKKEPTAINNESLENRGMDAAARGSIVPIQEIEKAKTTLIADPDAGVRIVENALQTPPDHDLTVEQSAQLIVHQATLENELERTTNIASDESRPPEERAAALERQGKAQDKLDMLNEVVKHASNIWHRMGMMRQIWLNSDFSLAGMQRMLRRAVIGKPTEEQLTETQRIAKELKDRQADIEKLQKEKSDLEAQIHKRNAVDTQQQMTGEEHGFTKTGWWERGKAALDPETRKVADRLEEQMRDRDLLRQELDRRAANAAAGSPRFSLGDAEVKGMTDAELKARLDALDKSIETTFKELDKATAKPGTPPEAKAAVDRAKKTAKSTKAKAPPIKPEDFAPALKEQTGKDFKDIPHSLLEKIARYHIRQGATTEPDLTERMRKTLDSTYPGITANDIHRGLSQMGQATYPSQEHVKKTLGELRNEMLKLAQIHSVLVDKQIPPKTGVQRRPPTARARELIKDLNRMLRESGLKAIDPEKQLADSRKAIVSRLKNDIEELDRVLSGKAAPRKPNEAPVYDAEMRALKQHRDELAAYVRDLTGPSAEHTWNQNAEKAARASESEWRRRIAEKEFEERTKPTPEATAATKRARADAQKAREEFEAYRDKLRPDIAQAKRLEAVTRDLKARRDALQDRLQNGKKPEAGHPPVSNAETQALEQEIKALQIVIDHNEAPGRRQAAALKAAERQAAAAKRRVEQGDLASKAKGVPATETPEIKAARQDRDFWNEILDGMKRAANPPRDPMEVALEQRKKAVAASIKEYERRDREQDYGPRLKKVPPTDRELEALKTKQERTRQAFQANLRKWRLDQRSKQDKLLDGAVAFKRAALLSSPVAAAKIAGAVLSRVGATGAEDVAGGLLRGVLPREFTEKAMLESAPLHVNADAFAKGISAALARGPKAFRDTLKTGKSDLDIQHGKAGAIHDADDPLTIFGRLHASIKTFAKEFAFARAQRILTQAYERAGQDVSYPAILTQINVRAYKEALRAVFMNDDVFSKMFNSAMRTAEQAGHPNLARAGRVLFPILKVPTNIVKEALTYVGGAPLGLTRLAKAWNTGFEHLDPEKADSIMRQIKKGSIGGALMLLGFYAVNNVGGYYNADDRRKGADVPAGGFRIFGVDVPKWMAHAPAFEAIQMGATLRRSLGAGHGYGDAALAGAIGLAEETPFLNEMFRINDLRHYQGRSKFFGELVKSNIEPALLQKIAEWTDRARPLQPSDLLTGEGTRRRNPGTFGQILEEGVPGLRETLPYKVDAPLKGTGIMLPYKLDFQPASQAILKSKNPAMTDDQFKRYADFRTTQIRRRLSSVLPAIQRLPEDRAKVLVARISHESNQAAKAAAGLR